MEIWYMIKNYLTYIKESKEEPIRTSDIDGTVRYMLNGKLHRDDGPAVEYPNGRKYWCKNGKLHRDDGGPAVVSLDGTKHWYVNGIRHRDDGPAVEYLGGKKEWWYEGKEYTLDEIENLIDKHPLKRGYIKYKFGI